MAARELFQRDHRQLLPPSLASGLRRRGRRWATSNDTSRTYRDRSCVHRCPEGACEGPDDNMIIMTGLFEHEPTAAVVDVRTQSVSVRRANIFTCGRGIGEFRSVEFVRSDFPPVRGERRRRLTVRALAGREPGEVSSSRSSRSFNDFHPSKNVEVAGSAGRQNESTGRAEPRPRLTKPFKALESAGTRIYQPITLSDDEHLEPPILLGQLRAKGNEVLSASASDFLRPKGHRESTSTATEALRGAQGGAASAPPRLISERVPTLGSKASFFGRAWSICSFVCRLLLALSDRHPAPI